MSWSDSPVLPWGPYIPDFNNDQTLAPGPLNAPAVTFYLGRGLFGDTNRLHPGILVVRE